MSVRSEVGADRATGEEEPRARRGLWPVLVTAGLVAVGARRQPLERRAAARPSRPQGWALWKLRLNRLKARIARDRLTAIAAGVTYFTLLSVFPAIAALVSLYGLFADPASVDEQLGLADGVVPGGGMDIIREQIDRLAAQGGGALGFAFAFSLLLSLWSANASTKAMFDALNVVYDEEEKRGFFKLNAISLLFTAGGILFLLLAIAAVVVLPVAFSYFGAGGLWETLVRIGRWPVLAAIVMLVLAVIYRFGPCRTEPRWRWITWGSAFATAAWIVMSLLFSWYAANFGSYDKTYGSLGAVIGFMTWMWLSANVVLLGAEIDAELEREEKCDGLISS